MRVPLAIGPILVSLLLSACGDASIEDTINSIRPEYRQLVPKDEVYYERRTFQIATDDFPREPEKYRGLSLSEIPGAEAAANLEACLTASSVEFEKSYKSVHDSGHYAFVHLVIIVVQDTLIPLKMNYTQRALARRCFAISDKKRDD